MDILQYSSLYHPQGFSGNIDIVFLQSEWLKSGQLLQNQYCWIYKLFFFHKLKMPYFPVLLHNNVHILSTYITIPNTKLDLIFIFDQTSTKIQMSQIVANGMFQDLLPKASAREHQKLPIFITQYL